MNDLLHHAATPYAPLIGVAPLMRRAFLQEDLAPLGEALLARAQAHPDDAHAYLDFSTVLQLKGERDMALAVQAQAIELQQLYALPAQAPQASRHPRAGADGAGRPDVEHARRIPRRAVRSPTAHREAETAKAHRG